MSALPPLLLPLVLVNVFGHVAISGGRVATSLYALDQGASEFLVGVIIAVYGVVPTFASLAMGRLVDRVGPAAPMRAGILAAVVGVALPAVVPAVPTLFATAVLCGLGFNVVSMSAQYAVGHLRRDVESDRVVHFGWLAVGHSISSVAGPLLAGVVIDAQGHRAAFAAVALVAGVAAVLVLRIAPRLASVRGPAATSSGGGALELFAAPAMRAVFVVGVLLALAWDLFTFLMPLLGHRQGLSASTIGTILATFAAGTFTVRVAMSRVAGRTTEWRILRAAVVVVVAVYVLLPLAQSPSLLLALAFLLGTAVGSAQPNVLSLLHAVAPPGRTAEAVGLRSMFGNASGVLVPLLFGATVATVGVAPVFWGVALLVATALPAAHRAAAPRR